jgi:hypothetical protein
LTLGLPAPASGIGAGVECHAFILSITVEQVPVGRYRRAGRKPDLRRRSGRGYL